MEACGKGEKQLALPESLRLLMQGVAIVALAQILPFVFLAHCCAMKTAVQAGLRELVRSNARWDRSTNALFCAKPRSQCKWSIMGKVQERAQKQ